MNNNKFSNLRVLAVDDNMMMINLMTNMLKNIGFEKIDTAMDGREGLEAIMDSKNNGQLYDIIFLDWNMPEKCGFDILRECREDLDFSKVAFVMVTAENQKRSILEATKTGANAYLTKPISEDTLKQKIENVVDWLERVRG